MGPHVLFGLIVIFCQSLLTKDYIYIYIFTQQRRHHNTIGTTLNKIIILIILFAVAHHRRALVSQAVRPVYVSPTFCITRLTAHTTAITMRSETRVGSFMSLPDLNWFHVSRQTAV